MSSGFVIVFWESRLELGMYMGPNTSENRYMGWVGFVGYNNWVDPWVQTHGSNTQSSEFSELIVENYRGYASFIQWVISCEKYTFVTA